MTKVSKLAQPLKSQTVLDKIRSYSQKVGQLGHRARKVVFSFRPRASMAITAPNTGRLRLSAWEEAGFSWDTDSLSVPPAASWKTLAGITDCWGLKEGECNAVCETAQDNVVATVVHYEDGDPRNIRSTDGGRTWSKLKAKLPCQWDGNVAVSRNDPNRFLIGQCTYDVHWYGHQGMSTDRYLKLTTDGGTSFTNARGSGTIHMWGGAIYGGNAMNLCADPNVDNRFLAFSNYDFYVYASTDGGASFTAINKARPFAVENGVWAKVFGIPGQPGHFYFCQGAGPQSPFRLHSFIPELQPNSK